MPIKDRCLCECRHPISFMLHHYRRGIAGGLQVGLRHGLHCIGCCWALMLVMFAVGVGNIGWMLALGAVMAIEKNMPIGRRPSMALGVVLLGWGVAVALT